MAPYEHSVTIEGVGTYTLFAIPKYNTLRNKNEPKCLDAHHLLVNAKVKFCKDGVEGIKKDAWYQAADADSPILNKAIVVDLIDEQTNAYAMKVFST